MYSLVTKCFTHHKLFITFNNLKIDFLDQKVRMSFSLLIAGYAILHFQ